MTSLKFKIAFQTVIFGRYFEVFNILNFQPIFNQLQPTLSTNMQLSN